MFLRGLVNICWPSAYVCIQKVFFGLSAKVIPAGTSLAEQGTHKACGGCHQGRTAARRGGWDDADVGHRRRDDGYWTCRDPGLAIVFVTGPATLGGPGDEPSLGCSSVDLDQKAVSGDLAFAPGGGLPLRPWDEPLYQLN